MSLASRSLWALLRSSAEKYATNVAIIDPHPAGERRTTYIELLHRATALGSELVRHGVRRGDCIAVWLPNWSESLIWQFAATALGAHVIGINTRYNVEEVVNVLDRAQPKVIAIAHGFAGLDLAARLRVAFASTSAPPASIAVIVGPHGEAVDAACLARFDIGDGVWMPECAEDQADFADHADALAVAFTTSGSTDKPKLAAHRSDAVAEHAHACVEAGGWRQGDVTLCALPLSGAFAYAPAMATLASGGTCLLEPIFQPERIVEDMARYGVTHVICADDVMARIAEAWHAKPVELPRWRHWMLADFNGRSLELATWAEERFGLKASGVYGSSELFALTSIWPAATPVPQRWRGGGAPVSKRIVVRCVDPETNQPVTPGLCGELQFRGYNAVDDYLGNSSLLQSQFTQDGWFRSGDLGIALDDDSFEYTCRIGDALRLKGFLVEPAEIETRLVEHPAVAAAKVVGLREADGETSAIAFVVLRERVETSPDALHDWCVRALAKHKVPKRVYMIEAMPTTSGVNGTKVKAATLREWAAAWERAESGG